jgi:MoaA/NifB/PqqE/SkfB family radical SAM enzyme
MELSENLYNRTVAPHQPKFKLWRSAGLLLSYKCNAACEFCYYNCSPEQAGLMPVDTAVSIWQSLCVLAGAGAKVHLTGGEPFLFFDRLCEILTAAAKQKLPPADLIETNGFWATDDAVVTVRLNTLAAFGIRRLKISVDPFHQEFVDIEPVRRLAAIAEDILGKERLLVRWRKYLGEPSEAKDLTLAERDSRYVASLKEYPCRFTGRAAGRLAELVADKPVESLKLLNCSGAFLGAKGVHIDPYGNVFSGTCSGIILGNVNERPLESIWQQFEPEKDPIIDRLFQYGPVGLLDEALKTGYVTLPLYAGKCHLCTSVRNLLYEKGLGGSTLGPAACYRQG